jgi:hypothetical protein
MGSQRDERCEEFARHPLCHGGSARAVVMQDTPECVLPTCRHVARAACAEDLSRGLGAGAGAGFSGARCGRERAAVGSSACPLGGPQDQAHARTHTSPVRAEAEKSASAALSMAFVSDHRKGLAISGVYLPRGSDIRSQPRCPRWPGVRCRTAPTWGRQRLVGGGLIRS